jgi:UDP-N-acetylmuramoyl-L-alanyl-D-glutamate--2,6-diaminopimelate ligase
MPASAAFDLANILKAYLSPELKAVTSDSREVKAGTVFVAVKGTTQDGHKFIAQAVQSGAALIVGEEPASPHAPALKNTPYVQVADSRLALAYFAAQLAGNPSHGLTVVGVTGTSGKTTTTYFIESILHSAGHRVGVVGTVNFRFGDKIYPSTHTTPGAPELQKLLAEMKKDGCTAVVMEVSSHALKQRRADFIAFDAVLFTNLTPEHLDFHPDMEDYYRSKTLLFTDALYYSIRAGKRPFAAVSDDDEWGKRLLREMRTPPNPLPEIWFACFGLSEKADLSARNLKITAAGIRGEAGGVRVNSPLIGKFNAQNLLGAIAASQGLHVNPMSIADGIVALKNVPGRLERVTHSRGVHVLVDYAHKSDALDKVLRVLREVKLESAQLITVFGCGGDRDKTKRPVMGKIAAELSDRVFVTSDNPRTEDPDAIIREIMAGMGTAGSASKSKVIVEPDRRKAIFAAISEARAGDWVLIAGKGHENYQIIGDSAATGGTRKIHFDDREVAQEAK